MHRCREVLHIYCIYPHFNLTYDINTWIEELLWVWLPPAPGLGTALALAREGGGLVVDDARPRPQLRPRPRPRHGARGWVARRLGGRVHTRLGRPPALLPVSVEGVEVGEIL